jgi:CubicO group peptidase (beta-lactamase class C family)
VRKRQRIWRAGNSTPDDRGALNGISALLWLFASGGVAGSPALRDSASANVTAQIDSVVRSDVARGFFGSVLVARGDRILLNRGYGVVAGVNVRADSRFWIASGGKQFTSAAILKCVEQGRLKLDDPITRFLPDVPSDKRSITVRQLLSHLSGLGQSYASEEETDRAVAVRRMLADTLVDSTGKRFHYSNSNYQLAVAIVEIVSGIDYKSFVQRELLSPLRLRNTGFSGSAGARQVLPAVGTTPARLRSNYWGGQGYYSTTADLFHWYRALRGGKVVAPAIEEVLFEPVTPIQEGQAALGWFIGKTEKGETRIFTRGNEDWGPNVLLYAYPAHDAVIVILTHAGNAPGSTSWSRHVLGQLEGIVLADTSSSGRTE